MSARGPNDLGIVKNPYAQQSLVGSARNDSSPNPFGNGTNVGDNSNPTANSVATNGPQIGTDTNNSNKNATSKLPNPPQFVQIQRTNSSSDQTANITNNLSYKSGPDKYSNFVQNTQFLSEI